MDYQPVSKLFSSDNVADTNIDRTDIIYKIIIIGNNDVGKSDFINKWMDSSTMTIGVDYRIKKFNIDGTFIDVCVWDTAGQERFVSSSLPYYKDTHGIILMYNIADRTTFDAIPTLLNNLKKNSIDDKEMILVGNRRSGPDTRTVSYDEGADFAEKNQIPFTEIDTSDGSNCEFPMRLILDKIHEQATINADLNSDEYALGNNCIIL